MSRGTRPTTGGWASKLCRTMLSARNSPPSSRKNGIGSRRPGLRWPGKVDGLVLEIPLVLRRQPYLSYAITARIGRGPARAIRQRADHDGLGLRRLRRAAVCSRPPRPTAERPRALQGAAALIFKRGLDDESAQQFGHADVIVAECRGVHLVGSSRRGRGVVLP